MYVYIFCSFRRQKCDQERKRADSKILRPYKKKISHVEYKYKSDNSNNAAAETISKSFRQYLSNIHIEHELEDLQTTAILGTTHILPKVLM
jgi:hypothetical protein